jgi:putative peptidoglycan lipid II flippase
LKKIRTSAQIAIMMVVFTLLSKFLGFVREIILASFYGTSYIVDTLNLANSIPSMLFAGILSATATSFIPLFSKKMETEGIASANRFTSQLINILFIVSVISSLIGIFFSHQIVTLFTMPEIPAPQDASFFSSIHWFLTNGWVGEKASLASFYVQITFSYTLFTSASGIFESYLKYKNIFLMPIVAGYLFNLAAVFFAYIAFKSTNPKLLILGFFLGQVLRCLVITVLAFRQKYHYAFDFHMSDTVKRIFLLAVPVFLGSTVGQINQIVSKSLASGLPEGSIASLGYADLVISLITGVTTTIISTVLYPKMAKAFAREDDLNFSNIFSQGITLIIIIGIPFTLGAMLYSDVIVQIIYERGAFGTFSTQLTSTAFFYASIGMVFAMMTTFLVSAFYSRHNTRTPLFIGGIVFIINILFNLWLVHPLANGGLTLGWSIASFFNAILLFVVIRKRTPQLVSRTFIYKVMKILFSACVSVFGTWLLFREVQRLFSENDWILPRMVLLGAIVLVASVVYLLLLRLLRIEELIYLRQIFRLNEKESSS